MCSACRLPTWLCAYATVRENSLDGSRTCWHTEHPRKEWLQKRKVKHKLVQVRRCGCRIECFTVDDHESELKHVMELVIVSQNCQFQHYTHFHEAKIKSSRTDRGQMLEAESEAEDKSSRPRPRPRTKFWPRGQLGHLTITGSGSYCFGVVDSRVQTLTNFYQRVSIASYANRWYSQRHSCNKR